MEAIVQSVVAAAAHDAWALGLVAFAAAAGEAIVVVGALVPGTAILLVIAAIAGASGETSALVVILVATILGSIAGDGLGYWLGRRIGRRLFSRWPLARYPGLLHRGDAYFARHGAWSVFLGRFVPGVKTVVPVIAGTARMGAPTFLVANIASAIFWSAATIAVGLGLGRGLARWGLADARVVILAVAAAVILAAAFWGLHLLLTHGLPWLGRLRLRVLARLEPRQGSAAAFSRRVLANEDNAVAALFWGCFAVAALAGFLVILTRVVFDTSFSAGDAIISNGVQYLRFPALDRVMVGITLGGDGVVTNTLGLVVIAWLLAAREWRVAGATVAAIGFSLAFVPLMKNALGRARPSPLYSGAEAFSFPSGHATHSMVMFGLIAVLLAHHQRLRVRTAIYATGLGVAALVAFSRVYLGAHWPSDVAAGMLFGASVIALHAFVLRNRMIGIHPARLAAVLAVVFAVTATIHVRQGFAHWSEIYAHAPQVTRLSPGDLRKLPGARIKLGDDARDRFIARFAGAPAGLADGLAAAGWREPRSSSLHDVLALILPYGGLKETPPRMALHDGRPPALTLIRRTGPARRLVLRVWPSAYALDVDAGAPVRPIYLVGLSAETFAPVLFGFGDLDAAPPAASERARASRAIRAAFEHDSGAPILLDP